MAEAKIATYCYCGRRTILQATANGGHELDCASHGGALHLMKPLKVPPKAPKVSSKNAILREEEIPKEEIVLAKTGGRGLGRDREYLRLMAL